MNIAKLHPYLLAEDIKQERRNFDLWLQGVYFFEAVSTALSNSFRKKGTEPYKYRSEPIRVTPLTEEEREIEKEKALEKVLGQLNTFEKNFNAKHKNK